MLTRTKRLAAVGAAVLTAGTGGFLSLGTATAAPRDVSFVMHFVAVRTSMSTPAAGAYYETNVEVTAGATVGQEVASCVSETIGDSCNAAFANANGIIDAQFTVDVSTGRLSGTVRGGTGRYLDVSGTISGTRVYAGEQVTIVYSRFLPPPITIPIPPITTPTLPTPA